MQLDSSTDFYDDDEDDDNDEQDENDYNYEDEEEKKSKLENQKALDLTVDTSSKRNNERRHITIEQEEIDMGYDEDDERIAAERPSSKTEETEKGYMNEEGSGGANEQGTFKRYKDETRFRPNYLTKYTNKKGRNMFKERNGGIEEVGTREGSGNFANDDEDNNNDDDDDDDGVNDDDENGNNDGGFFASKRKTNNRYFRKNTNDAIKIISTPLGKVGIVYQQTPTEEETSFKKTESTDKKQSTVLTDFDALSPDPDSSRLASSHPKITPVLTPDGKVALLYRGDSENTKYEPIRNLTHKLINNNSNNNNNKEDTKDTDNKDGITSILTATNTNKKQQQKAIFAIDSDEQNSDLNESNSSDFDEEDDTTKLLEGEEQNKYDKTETDLSKVASHTPIFVPPTSGSFIIRPTDSVLPMINRPLSEVLGIKKNQFKQFRVKDIAMTSSTDGIPRSLSGNGGNVLNEQTSSASSSSSSTTLHFLTKVNLAEYPTSIKGPNRDFDFSQDNTMLDERNRHREQQITNEATNEKININTKIVNNENAFTNEEMLSKTEVVDLAIIPHIENEYGRFNKHEVDARRHHRNRQIHRHRQKDEDLSGIHCVMQIMMGIAAISTVFGMLGTFFKQRILDQLRLMHW